MARWTERLSWALASPPSVDDYAGFLHRAVDSTCGEDGLPYRAWVKAGQVAAETLCDVGALQRSGISMLMQYFAVVMCFAPKDDDIADRAE